MRGSPFWIGLAMACVVAPAQDAPSDNQRKYEAKLREEFATAAPWLASFDAAKAEAHRSGKLIFAYFTRSYAP